MQLNWKRFQLRVRWLGKMLETSLLLILDRAQQILFLLKKELLK